MLAALLFAATLLAAQATAVGLTLGKDQKCVTCVAYALTLRGASWTTHPKPSVTDMLDRRTVLVREERLQQLQDFALTNSIYNYRAAPPPLTNINDEPEGKYQTTAHRFPPDYVNTPAMSLWPSQVLSWRNTTHPETLGPAHRESLDTYENHGGNPAAYEFLKLLQEDVAVTEAVEEMLRRDLALDPVVKGSTLLKPTELIGPSGEGLDTDSDNPINVFLFTSSGAESSDQCRWADEVCGAVCVPGRKRAHVPTSAFPIVDQGYIEANPGPETDDQRELAEFRRKKAKVKFSIDGKLQPDGSNDAL